MTDTPPDEAAGPENPLEAVFEAAVRPFENGDALRAEIPPETPVVVLRKGDELPPEARDLGEGGTLKIPVLAALKDSKLSEWHKAASYDFGSLGREEIGLLFIERGAGEAQLKVVTRGRGDALLVADLGAMLEALHAAASTPGFRAFPGADVLVEALAGGIEAAKRELMDALGKPDASGKSLIEKFRESAGRRA